MMKRQLSAALQESGIGPAPARFHGDPAHGDLPAGPAPASPRRGGIFSASALVLAGLLGGLALSSCAPLAVAAVGIVITDEWKDNALTADVQADVEPVWASVLRSMSNMTDALLHVDEDHRAIQTRVDNSVVLVHVEQWAVHETRVYVEAKKYMVTNPEVAQLVMERLVRDLEQ